MTEDKTETTTNDEPELTGEEALKELKRFLREEGLEPFRESLRDFNKFARP